MSVQLQTRPTTQNSAGTNAHRMAHQDELDFDLDVVDSALDRGDLETVRRELGLSRAAWGLLISKL